MSNRPNDILLPQGWDWDRVEQHRARYGVAEDMVPETAYGSGPVTAWCTIGWHRYKMHNIIMGELACGFRVAGGVVGTVRAWQDEPTLEAMREAYWEDRLARVCHNAEPGTYGHECGKPAAWVGVTPKGFRCGFCADCKERGHEARHVVAWEPVPPVQVAALAGEVASDSALAFDWWTDTFGDLIGWTFANSANRYLHT